MKRQLYLSRQTFLEVGPTVQRSVTWLKNRAGATRWITIQANWIEYKWNTIQMQCNTNTNQLNRIQSSLHGEKYWTVKKYCRQKVWHGEKYFGQKVFHWEKYCRQKVLSWGKSIVGKVKTSTSAVGGTIEWDKWVCPSKARLRLWKPYLRRQPSLVF